METKDIGFGTKVGGKGNRLLNTNGKFNIKKLNTKFDVYHFLVSCSRFHFIVCILSFYAVINAIFALLYNLIGIEHLAGIEYSTHCLTNFLSAFFFSVQTFTTVGYGAVHPVGHAANLIASTEALFGILSVSLVSGILFGRFTQKRESIVFSRQAVITHLNGLQTLQFRIANKRTVELIEMHARCVCSMMEIRNGEKKRQYFNMELERNSLMLFPLNWTIVHPINENSPLYDKSRKELIDQEFEMIILISGFDDSAKQTIYSKYSYVAEDLIYDHKFVPAYKLNHKGETVFDLKDIHEIIKS